MAILPKILLTFNEGGPALNRDYSENGNDGVGTGLSNVTSTRVGLDLVFNSDTDSSRLHIIDDLNGSSEMSIHLGVKFNTTTGDRRVLTNSGQLNSNYNHDTGTFNFDLLVFSGTATVSYALLEGQFYDIDIVYENDILSLYIDGVEVVSDATQNGVIEDNADFFYIGHDLIADSSFMNLNEFKLYNEAITTAIIQAVIDSPNGVLSDSGVKSEFEVGDIIFTDYENDIKFGIITYVDEGLGSAFRFTPLTSGIMSSSFFDRGGHLWGEARQCGLKMDKEPSIKFYANQSKSTEIFAESKETYRLTKDGIINPSIEKTDDYTLTNTDQTVYLTGSTAKTFTMPAAPTNDKEWNIINLSTAVLTIDGNGKNVDGSSTQNLISKYDSAQIKYINSEFVIK